VGFSLTFPKEDEAVIRLSTSSDPADKSTLELAVGLDNVFRITPRAREGLPAAAKGFWEKENVFVIYLDEIGNINNWRVRLTFDGDRATFFMHDNTGLGETTMIGKRVPG
jgi:hypothetical protein